MEHMYDQNVLMFLVLCFLFWFRGRAAEALRADEMSLSRAFLEVFGSPWKQLRAADPWSSSSRRRRSLDQFERFGWNLGISRWMFGIAGVKRSL